MKKVRVSVEGWGFYRDAEIECSDEEIEFLKRLAREFNLGDAAYSNPMKIQVEGITCRLD